MSSQNTISRKQIDGLFAFKNIMQNISHESHPSVLCPACGVKLKLCDKVCYACGARTYIACPFCGKETFIRGNCRYCRKSLYIACPNKSCGNQQLITHNGICKTCGAAMRPCDNGDGTILSTFGR